MAAKQRDNLFKRLERLFKSGPVVKRKVRSFDTRVVMPDPIKSSAVALFQKSVSPMYTAITANAYNLAERLMRYNDFQEMEQCLHGDTLIAVPGGFRKISDLAADGVDKEFVVYSYDHNTKSIVPALARQARQTVVEDAYKVTFDDGNYIIGSAAHRLLKRDGYFCEIQDLKSGDAMMPFYRKDLREGRKDARGYQWIYTMDRDRTKSGWYSEHRLLAEWVSERRLTSDEVVHHINHVPSDNSMDNLVLMSKDDHQKLHKEDAARANCVKWSEKNREWIDNFRRNHSKFMTENNPAERRDITFACVLDAAIAAGFNHRSVQRALDASSTAIETKIRRHGYQSWSAFASAYDPSWKNAGQNNDKDKNPRFDASLTAEAIYSSYVSGMTLRQLEEKLDTTGMKVLKRLKWEGYDSFTDFKARYQNLKVVSVEYYGKIPLYDLTVDGYKNFATDSIISHNTPEIAAAMDIYADETCAQDEKGRTLHVYSENTKIKETLEDLFYDTLNVEFNLRPWARSLVKFGDFFLYNDVHPDHGVMNAIPIPINEIERIEGYDKTDPLAVKFRWVGLANRELENWEVTHMRLLGNDTFLPYGSSIIEAARRIWRQLILIEDAMLVYRVVRAPERRVFYIDVGNLDNDAIPTYIEQQKQQLRTNQVVDKNTGRVDLRYNPMSVDEDYYIPVRGSETGTKIDTLAGGQNAAAVEDVAYIQKKLFAALKIPRAYLGYDEMLSSKATLAQEDIRFSRSINMIQRTMIAELNKLAIIHLYAHGFEGEDLLNFTLRLSNPSTVAQQQKLEVYRAKFEIAGSAPEGLLSRKFLLKNILMLNDDEIKDIDAEQKEDAIRAAAVGAAGEGGVGGGGGGGGGSGLGGAPPSDVGEEEPFGAEGEPPTGAAPGSAPIPGEPGTVPGEEPPPDEEAPEEESDDTEEEEPGAELLTSSDDPDDIEDEPKKIVLRPGESPIRPNQQARKNTYLRNPNTDNQLKNADRAVHRDKTRFGSHNGGKPDFVKMTGTKGPSMKDPFDMAWMKSIAGNPFGEGKVNESTDYFQPRPTMSRDAFSALEGASRRWGWKTEPSQERSSNVLNESLDELDLEVDFDGLDIEDEDE